MSDLTTSTDTFDVDPFEIEDDPEQESTVVPIVVGAVAGVSIAVLYTVGVRALERALIRRIEKKRALEALDQDKPEDTPEK